MSLKDESLKLGNQICFRLYKASRAMTRVYQPILESLRLTYPQYVTMLVLWEDKRIDFKKLGKRLDMKTGTLTPILKKLEELGYATREKNRDDHRKIWVRLTAEGEKLKSKALMVPEMLLKNMDMNFEQYLKYAAVLDEIGEILSVTENQQKIGKP